MDSPAIVTLIKMMESLPEAEQNQIVEAVRAYIANSQDDLNWDQSFTKKQSKLVEAARNARQQIKENRSVPFDPNRL